MLEINAPAYKQQSQLDFPFLPSSLGFVAHAPTRSARRHPGGQGKMRGAVVNLVYGPGEDSSAGSFLCRDAGSKAGGGGIGRTAPSAAGRSAGVAPAGTCPAGSAGSPVTAGSCASELRLSRSPAMLTPRSPACAEALSFVDIPDCPKKHFGLCYLLSGTVNFVPLMLPGNHMLEHVCTVLRQRSFCNAMRGHS